MNKKNMFTGWNKVFHFTFHQATKGKGFKMATFGVAFGLCIILLVINVVLAETAKKENSKNEIKEAVVLNQTEMEVDFSSFAAVNTDYKGIRFNKKESTEDKIKEKDLKENAVGIQMVNDTDTNGYLLKISYLDDGNIDEDQAEAFAEKIRDYVEKYKIAISNATEEQIQAIITPFTSEMTTAGSQTKGVGALIFQMVAPMVIYFLLYFMLISYGQSISKIIISEKSSKVMELLLTSVKPYAVITGKILGMTVVAILQICMWVAGSVAGFVLGNYIGKQINPEYQNIIVQILKTISDNSDGSTFSIPILLISVFVLFFGFFFYCVLAGLAASTVSKPEELSSAMSIFVLPVVFSFLAVYMLPVFVEEVWVKTLLRYIPFTGAFCIPADLLVGNITIAAAILPILLMGVTSIIIIYATGKIYKKKLF